MLGRICKKLLLLAAVGLTFFLGFEVGGFQLALLRAGTEFTLTNTSMGFLVAAENAAIMIVAMLFGRIADRFGKKIVLLLGATVFATGCAAMAFTSSPVMLAAFAFVIGGGYGMIESQCSAAVADVYPEKSSRYISIIQGSYSLGALVSPLLLDFFMTNCGANWRLAFMMSAGGMLLFVIPLIMADFTPAMLRQNKVERDNQPIKTLMTAVFVTLLISMFVYVWIEQGASYFFDSLFASEHISSGFGAIAISLFWLATGVTRFTFGFLRLSARNALIVCFIVITLSLLPLALVTNAVVALISCVVVGLACGPIWPLLLSEATRYSPERSGQAGGFMVGASGGGATIAPIFTGFLAAQAGFRVSYLVLAALGAGCAVLCAIVFWKTKA